MNSSLLPDVSTDSSANIYENLKRVGMEKVEMPVKLDWTGAVNIVPSLVNAYVSLDDKSSKGIHMSRLYHAVKAQLENHVVSIQGVKKILSQFIDSQEGISKSSEIRINFDYIKERESLVSKTKGYRTYPISLVGTMSPSGFSFRCRLTVAYSSTCPCSAALSRHLSKENFIKTWKGKELDLDQLSQWFETEDAVAATPHAQRSYAYCDLVLSDSVDLKSFINSTIDQTELVLATPVQASVKRVDEQEFARLNATNLMFCEDAARKLKQQFTELKSVQKFQLKVEHREALHPHNAVAYAQSDKA